MDRSMIEFKNVGGKLTFSLTHEGQIYIITKLIEREESKMKYINHSKKRAKKAKIIKRAKQVLKVIKNYHCSIKEAMEIVARG